MAEIPMVDFLKIREDSSNATAADGKPLG